MQAKREHHHEEKEEAAELPQLGLRVTEKRHSRNHSKTFLCVSLVATLHSARKCCLQGSGCVTAALYAAR